MKERLAENSTSIKYPNDKKTNRVAYRDTKVDNIQSGVDKVTVGRRNHTRLIFIIVIKNEASMIIMVIC